MPVSSPDTKIQMTMKALAAGLRHGGVCVLHQDFEHRFDLAENPPEVWLRSDLLGLVESDILPFEPASRFAAAYDRCRNTSTEQVVSFDVGDGLKRRQFEARLTSDETGVLTVVLDRTEQHTRETAVAALLREVSHRSKNLLAIVQSVAMQTAHHSGSTADFLNRFRGRLHALSSTQDLVTESNWRGTHFKSLVTAQLSRVGAPALVNLRVTGENPLLGPNASLHIGLAIHELGVNAVRYGALADGNTGQIWIDAHLATHPGAPSDLVIEWQETGAAVMRDQPEPRFGTLVLERIVPLSVGGTAGLDMQQDSVRYRLVVPADQFEA